MRINVFNGGLHTRPAPHLIKTNESREFTNVDNSTGILTPLKTPLATAIQDAKQYAFFSEAEDEWFFSDTPVDWLEFQERVYFTDRIGAPKKIVDGAEFNLGIVPPNADSAESDVLYPPAPPDIDDAAITRESHPAGTFPLGQPAVYHVANMGPGGVAAVSSSRLVFNLPPPSEPTGFVVEMPQSYGIAGINWRLFRAFDGKLLGAGFQDTTDVNKATIIDRFYEELGSEVNTGLRGVYQYAITYYSTSTGIESGAYVFDEVQIDGGAYRVTLIPESTDPQVDKIRVYRLGGSLSAFTLVTTIDNIPNASFTDARRDYELDGRLLRTANHLPAKVGLKYLTEAYAMLFGALDDKVYYTPIGIPDAWPELYFLDFPATVTAIVPVSNGIIICTKYKSYLVTGTGPNSFSIQLASSDQGCIDHSTVSLISGTGLWVSREGVCASNGSGVQVITKVKLGKQSFDTVMSAVYDEAYYLQLADGSVFIVDFNDRILRKENHGLTSVIAANDKLYGFVDDTLWECYAGEDDLEYEFVSAYYVGELYTRSKMYKSVYFTIKGTVDVQVFVDGVLAAEKTLSSNATEIKEVKVSEKHKRGTAISYRVVGSGTVYEVLIDEDSANV